MVATARRTARTVPQFADEVDGWKLGYEAGYSLGKALDRGDVMAKAVANDLALRLECLATKAGWFENLSPSVEHMNMLIADIREEAAYARKVATSYSGERED